MRLFSIKEDVRSIWCGERQNNIDLLRAIAVVSVFIHHAQVTFGGSFPFLGDYGGQFGPQLFFLISGYLISGSCEKHGIRDYAVHRVFRIVPAYLLFFVGFGVLTGAITFDKVVNQPWKFFANLILLQQIFPSALLAFDVLHVTWTLTVEVLWYMAAPLLLIGSKKLRWPLVLGVTILSTLWSLAASTHALDVMYPEFVQKNPGFSYLFVGNHFFSQICFFIFGAWIYFNKKIGYFNNPFALMVVGVIVFLLRPYYMIFNPIFITGIGLGLFFLAAIRGDPVKSRLVFLISEISYSVYLCHFPVILWVYHGLGLKSIQGVVVSIFITLIVSLLSYGHL